MIRLTSVSMGLAMALSMAGDVLRAGEGLQGPSAVFTTTGKRIAQPLSISDLHGLRLVGHKSAMGFALSNRLGFPVRIPAPSLGFGTPILSLKVLHDGAEEVTYHLQDSGASEGDAVSTPVIQVDPKGEACLLAWFTPWSPGTYSYALRLRNDLRKRKVHRMVAPETPPHLTVYKEVEEDIPNVWVGDVTLTGTFVIGDDVPEDVAKEISALEKAIGDAAKPLRERSAAISKLVGMRHSRATETIAKLEKRTAAEPLMHLLIVVALRDMAYQGTGYRALPLVAELASNKALPVAERALCIDVLTTFATQKHLKHDGRVIHVVTQDEAKAAQTAIQRLKAGIADEPQEIQQLLRRAPDPPVLGRRFESSQSPGSSSSPLLGVRLPSEQRRRQGPFP